LSLFSSLQATSLRKKTTPKTINPKVVLINFPKLSGIVAFLFAAGDFPEGGATNKTTTTIVVLLNNSKLSGIVAFLFAAGDFPKGGKL